MAKAAKKTQELKSTVDKNRIFYLFRVDLRSGRLFWKNPSKYHQRLLGTEAGTKQKHHTGKCYWIIKIDGRSCRRGHLIFIAARGRAPYPLVDHRNGNSLDDRPGNLRDATITQNAWNHKSRRRRIKLPMGVRILVSSGRYQARIGFHGHQIHLGAYDTPAEARAIYLTKRKELYQEFA